MTIMALDYYVHRLFAPKIVPNFFQFSTKNFPVLARHWRSPAGVESVSEIANSPPYFKNVFPIFKTNILKVSDTLYTPFLISFLPPFLSCDPFYPHFPYYPFAPIFNTLITPISNTPLPPFPIPLLPPFPIPFLLPPFFMPFWPPFSIPFSPQFLFQPFVSISKPNPILSMH